MELYENLKGYSEKDSILAFMEQDIMKLRSQLVSTRKLFEMGIENYNITDFRNESK